MLLVNVLPFLFSKILSVVITLDHMMNFVLLVNVLLFLFSRILSVVITLDHMMNFVFKMSESQGFYKNKYYEKTYLSAVFSVHICWFLQP